jgi:LemA protein
MTHLAWLVPGFLLAFAAAAAVLVYNGLVGLRNDCDRAWSNIDVLLKQRYDEIPNLVEVCRGYMRHEQTTLERVAQARAAGLAARERRDRGAADHAGAQTAAAVAGLFAVAERYPDLKADRQFLRLQERITGLESEIADRREHFNSCVTNYNIRIEQLPDAFIAGPLGFRRRPLLRIAPAERRVPDVAVAREAVPATDFSASYRG